LLNSPALHSVHDVAAGGEKVPAGQTEQLLPVTTDECSAEAANVPAGQKLHESAPVSTLPEMHTTPVPVGLALGCPVGLVGLDEGCAVGCREGCPEGCMLGCTLGCTVGCREGCAVGCTEGWVEGCLVGCTVGCTEGCRVGCLEGWLEGLPTGC
jgi:hypothetical protein